MGWFRAALRMKPAAFRTRRQGFCKSFRYGIAARLLGLCQPDVSRFPRGDFREDSLERPLRMLTALG